MNRVNRVILSLYILLSWLVLFVWSFWSMGFAQDNDIEAKCDACDATPDQLLQYRDAIIYILKNLKTTPKTNFSNMTWSYSDVVIKANFNYMKDQAEELFEIGTQVFKKRIGVDVATDFIQNLVTTFRSRVYTRDIAKIKILDDMINRKANQIIVDGRWDEDVAAEDLESIKKYIQGSKVFSKFENRFSGYKEIIWLLYDTNQNIKTWISFWTMSSQINYKWNILTFDDSWIKNLNTNYDCVRWSFSCNNKWKEFVSKFNGVWKKVTSDWKMFTRRISSSLKKLNTIRFKWYFKNTKLVKINTSVPNIFDNNMKDIQSIETEKKQIEVILNNYIMPWVSSCPSLAELSSNLSQNDANKMLSMCNNMMNWIASIINESDKVDIYTSLSDPITITKLFPALSQKVAQARWDNKSWIGWVTNEVTDMCINVCPNLNDWINCSS